MKYFVNKSLCLLLGASMAMPIAATEKLVSNRSGARDKFIAVVKLKSPALLTSAKQINGRTVVDEKLKKRILKEQEKFLARVRNLSPEVQILFKYRMVLNGISLVLPKNLESEFSKIPGVSSFESNGKFSRPSSVLKGDAATVGENTSVNFINSNLVHEKLKITGKKITVGVLDTGIDYTHSMFKGVGTTEAFESIDPAEDAPEHYPNAKVIGGIDLVGTEYNAASADFNLHIPRPDNNPIDEGGHGSHVAGSIAGIGNGDNSYSGVAPDALLHSIKVFGANGSTSDSVVLAGLEYAADPNKDLNPKDKLDVVNLSLGGGFGKPHILYSEAIKHLTKGGTVVVASAGNSGHEPYIVGAPSTAKEAISVAASVDNMDHNWKFDAVKFSSEGAEDLLAEVLEGNISKPVADSEGISGKLVLAGVAANDFPAELKDKLKGNIALIDRGEVSFIEKLKRAKDAGAIGVIVANSKPGAAIRMGGEGKVDLPAVMITLENANIIKEQMKSNDVLLTFKTEFKIEKPELVDTLTSFSSQGPRSVDSLLKPEISAPGSNIVSAKMGGGSETVRMSGTSMSGPHMAGVMALMKEKFPTLSVKDLKSLALTKTKIISDKEGTLYPISKQGAGRVDAYNSVSNSFVILPATVSLGNLETAKNKRVRKTFKITNLSNKDSLFKLKGIENEGLTIKFAKKFVKVKAGKTAKFTVIFKAITKEQKESVTELNGHILLENDSERLSLPVLGILKKESRIHRLPDLNKDQVTFKNTGKHEGELLLFKRLARDPRKVNLRRVDNNRSKSCDLKSVGYRVIEKEVEGKQLKLLQIGVELYDVMTRWQGCELSMLVDADKDGMPEQEIAGVSFSNLRGLNGHNYATFVLDYSKMRELRNDYERAVLKGEDAKLNYMPAIEDYQDMLAINHSRYAVLSIDMAKLSLSSEGNLNFKFGALHEDSGAIGAEDYIKDGKWLTLDANELDNAEIFFHESYILKAGEKKKIQTAVKASKVMAVLPEQN